eukprot:3939016-Rhodomonas_salina.2
MVPGVGADEARRILDTCVVATLRGRPDVLRHASLLPESRMGGKGCYVPGGSDGCDPQSLAKGDRAETLLMVALQLCSSGILLPDG